MAKHKLPRFAKRHYESVAKAMQEAVPYAECKANAAVLGGVQTAIKELASMFAKDNGQFDRDRFERACVPGANVRSKKNPLPAMPVNEWVR